MSPSGAENLGQHYLRLCCLVIIKIPKTLLPAFICLELPSVSVINIIWKLFLIFQLCTLNLESIHVTQKLSMWKLRRHSPNPQSAVVAFISLSFRYLCIQCCLREPLLVVFSAWVLERGYQWAIISLERTGRRFLYLRVTVFQTWMTRWHYSILQATWRQVTRYWQLPLQIWSREYKRYIVIESVKTTSI